MTTEAQPLSAEDLRESEGEVRRALRALYIEVPELVARDVGAIVWNHVDALTSENDRLTRQLKRATEAMEWMVRSVEVSAWGECPFCAERPSKDASGRMRHVATCPVQIARDTLAAVKEAGNV